MQRSLDRGLSITLTVATLVIGAILVRREFLPPTPPTLSAARPPASHVANWRDALPAGRIVGNPDAPVMVVVFADFECPFCRQFHTSLRAAVARYPDKVAYAFVHFPLPHHRLAQRAARVAECADQVGRFPMAVNFLFAHQDSLGLREWGWFAEGAGVQDLEAFNACMADPTMPNLVAAGLSLAEPLSITGTPVVFLNGWRYPGMPSAGEFMAAVDSLVAGKRPYPDFPAAEINARTRTSDSL